MGTDAQEMNARAQGTFPQEIASAGTASGLREILDSLQKLAKKRSNRLAVQMLGEVKEKLTAETFTLVVMGEFKRGKSTLINAFLGEEVLPTGVLPLTSVPTIICYGERPLAWVSYLNGNRQEIALTDISLYVSEKENPHNNKEVRQVELDFPLSYLQKGMILVDTPGIGSVYEHNTAAAYSFLPHADAAMVLTAVDAPLSKTELEYLRDIRTQVPKLFFALNKIDSIKAGELPEVVQFTYNLLVESLEGQEIILFPISARLALEGKIAGDAAQLEGCGWQRLEQFIADLLEKGKLDLIIKIAAGKGLRVTKQLNMEIRLWQQALLSSSEDLAMKIGRFQAALSGIKLQQEESIHLLYHEVDLLGKEIAEDTGRLMETMLPGLKEELKAYFQTQMESRASAREMVEIINTFIQKRLQTVLFAWRQDYLEGLHNKFVRTAQRFFDRIEETVEQMLAVSAEIFQISYEPVMLKNYIQEQKKIFFHFYAHPSFIPSMEDLASFGIIPKWLISRRLYKSALYKLEDLLDRNCGRMRYELTEGLKENARTVAGELRMHADLVAQGLAEALERAQTEKQSKDDNKEVLEDAQRDLAQLRSWESTLAALQ